MSAELRATLAAHGQAHLVAHLDALPAGGAEAAAFEAQLAAVDWAHVSRAFKASVAADAEPARPAAPVAAADVAALAGRAAGDAARWRAAGLRFAAAGRLGVLLLAGGQGTRLGSAAPKGCYSIGLPSGKSLFQLQAERIRRLQALAAAEAGAPEGGVTIPWYVMTSPATDAATRAFFAGARFFGLDASQVFFFSQGALPALDGATGAAIVEARGRLAMAPDGNGGVYAALAASGALADMRARGVAGLDVVSVDNALVRPGDPEFVGFCLERGAHAGSRAVAKAYPEEKVGVFALRGGRLEVVEYSELDPAEAAAADGAAGGRLRYGWSNVCMHYFDVAWLEDVAARLAAAARYHLARKTIPSVDGPVAGVKLELFIFDAFPYAAAAPLFEVPRAAQFAPVKNAPGSGADSPEAARAAVLAEHARWLAAAGAAAGGGGAEVSPLVSYAGEGLAAFAGRTFREPLDAELQGGGPPTAAAAAAGGQAEQQPVAPGGEAGKARAAAAGAAIDARC